MKIVTSVLCVLCALLIAGSAHSATIGYTGNGASVISLEGVIRGQAVIGGTRLIPASTGTWDSITVYVRTTAEDPAINYSCRCAIYTDTALVSGSFQGNLVDSTAEFTITGSTSQLDARYSRPVLVHANALSTQKYMVACWGKAGTGTLSIFYDVTTSADSALQQTRNYTSLPAWPNPATSFTANTSVKHSIYATYTPLAQGGRRSRYLRSELIKEATEGFAEDDDEEIR